MKKIWLLLPIIILTLCLVGFAIDRLEPASPVSAANEVQPVSMDTSLGKPEAAQRASTVQPVVFVAAGLVCSLFGVLAIAPLFLKDWGG